MSLKIKSLLFIFLLISAFNSYANAVRFCFENNANSGKPYYPQFVINGKVYYSNYGHRIECFNLGELTGNYVTLHTNGFELDYQNNIVSFANFSCGKSTPCLIPMQYQNEELYYIHVTVWPLDNKNLTGVLNAIYKP